MKILQNARLLLFCALSVRSFSMDEIARVRSCGESSPLTALAVDRAGGADVNVFLGVEWECSVW